MSKRSAYHLLIRLRDVKYAYFVILLVVSLGTFVFAYRQNNLTALHLRDTLLQVDKDNGNVQAALNNLRKFTYAHMNADIGTGNGVYPPIQLVYTYQRLMAAEEAKANAQNSNLYTEAQKYCEIQVTSRLTTQRVPCIQDYLASHGTAKAQAIPDALYKFDFVSPAWSPDLAGWSLLVAMVSFIGLVTRIILQLWLRHVTRD